MGQPVPAVRAAFSAAWHTLDEHVVARRLQFGQHHASAICRYV